MKARLPQNFKGQGAGNMQGMIKQAQKMQEDMSKLQAELEEKEYTINAGGGAVSVVITGKKEFKSLNIDPEIIDPDDKEMLQDTILAAFNEAINKVEAISNEKMGEITGGLSIPGLM